jgi:hypothetical protein
VIDDLATGVRATDPWAGVHTFLADASGGQAALGADDALRSAVGRASGVGRLAGADAGAVHDPLLAVGSAGIRVAWVFGYNRF